MRQGIGLIWKDCHFWQSYAGRLYPLGPPTGVLEAIRQKEPDEISVIIPNSSLKDDRHASLDKLFQALRDHYVPFPLVIQTDWFVCEEYFYSKAGFVDRIAISLRSAVENPSRLEELFLKFGKQALILVVPYHNAKFVPLSVSDGKPIAINLIEEVSDFFDEILLHDILNHGGIGSFDLSSCLKFADVVRHQNSNLTAMGGICGAMKTNLAKVGFRGLYYDNSAFFQSNYRNAM